MHNYFTVKSGEKEITAFNTIYNINSALKRNNGYAKFIVLGGGGGVENGALKNKKYAKAVTLSFINTDVCKGALRAVYTVNIENEQGLNFNELSLCENEDGSNLVSYATCENFVYAGEPVSVSMTIFAHLSGDFQLCGGNNVLTRWLLGANRNIGAYKLGCGNCTYPGVMVRKAEDLSFITDAATAWHNDYCFFQATIPNNNRDEYVVLQNNIPILRTVPVYEEISTIEMKTVGKSLTIEISAKNPVEVFNVEQNSVQITSAFLKRKLSAPTVIDGIIPFKLGRVAYIKTDPLEEYFAAVTGSEVHLFKFSDSGITLELRTNYSGEYVDVCSDGSLVIWGDTMRIFTSSANAPYIVTEVNLSRGSQNAVISEGNYYHAARLFEGNIYRYKISGNNAELLETIVAASGENLFRNGLFIGWGGKNCEVGCKTIFQRNGYFEAEISALFNNNGVVTQFSPTDNIAVFKSVQKNGLVMHNAGFYYPFKADAEYVVSDRCFIERIDGIAKLYVVDCASGEMQYVYSLGEVGFKAKEIRSAKNWCVILCDDGTIKTLNFASDSAYLCSPDFKEGQQVSYIVKSRPQPKSATNQYEVRFTLNYS